MKLTILLSLAILVVVSFPHQGFPAEQKPVVPSQEWSGSIDDITIRQDVPEVVLSAEKFENLWLSWKLPGPVPAVDFSSNLVIVQTTKGSKLRLAATQDDTGNLKVLGLATLDLHPGFRYVIAILSRTGVKTVNGKELPNQEGKINVETGPTLDHADFSAPAGIEIQSVKAIDPKKMNDEISQAYRKDEVWPKEVVLVALRFVGAGLKGNAKTIEVIIPQESQETATISITESGYLDDAIRGERWRLWLAKKTDGTWEINRVLWAQLCSRPGRRFYSAGKCP